MPGDHINGYKTATLNPSEFQHRGRATVKQKEDYPVIARPWGMYGTDAQESIMDYWVNEKDAPYVEKRPLKNQNL